MTGPAGSHYAGGTGRPADEGLSTGCKIACAGCGCATLLVVLALAGASWFFWAKFESWIFAENPPPIERIAVDPDEAASAEEKADELVDLAETGARDVEVDFTEGELNHLLQATLDADSQGGGDVRVDLEEGRIAFEMVLEVPDWDDSVYVGFDASVSVENSRVDLEIDRLQTGDTRWTGEYLEGIEDEFETSIYETGIVELEIEEDRIHVEFEEWPPPNLEE